MRRIFASATANFSYLQQPLQNATANEIPLVLATFVFSKQGGECAHQKIQENENENSIAKTSLLF